MNEITEAKKNMDYWMGKLNHAIDRFRNMTANSDPEAVEQAEQWMDHCSAKYDEWNEQYNALKEAQPS